VFLDSNQCEVRFLAKEFWTSEFGRRVPKVHKSPSAVAVRCATLGAAPSSVALLVIRDVKELVRHIGT
jgi:hypothetical protein